jgi:hypothetical protein
VCSGFNLVTFVDNAFKGLTSDVELSAITTIGDYQTTLKYTQKTVPTKADDSLNLILQILSGPIVQMVLSLRTSR